MTRDEAIAKVTEAAEMMAEILENDDPPHPRDEIEELWEAIDLLRKPD